MFSQTIIATAALIGLMATASPAVAAPSADTRVKAKVIERNGTTLYCVKESATGTRVPRRICMTPQQWNDAGAHVAEPAAQVKEEATEMASSARKKGG